VRRNARGVQAAETAAKIPPSQAPFQD
jgi:hypothetical protein